jgi:hypothetical protein
MYTSTLAFASAAYALRQFVRHAVQNPMHGVKM